MFNREALRQGAAERGKAEVREEVAIANATTQALERCAKSSRVIGGRIHTSTHICKGERGQLG